ncbi:hypothetical protein ACFXO2_37140 [Streptomyces sp. NPDC059152]|uniref:hypothetical protein n=1 Tax=Streptomyces sp. NPDC059152 TaxID=3346742 RepID=UPI0036CD4371
MADSVVQAILDATKDPHVRESMLLGSRLESSWNPGAVGDNGTSFGPFQIHLPAHPGVTAAQAQNPAWATRYMLSAYQRGAAAQPESLWQSNPERAAEQAAVAAEAPAQPYYASGGAESVHAAWRATTGALGGRTPADGTPPGGGGGAAASNAGFDPFDPLGGLTSFIAPIAMIGQTFAELSTIFTWWWMHKMKVAFISVGVVFFLIGIVFFAKDNL